MADAAKSASQAETAGATQAADARRKDLSSIQAEEQALRQLGVTAKSTNKDLVYGGRNDMQQHLTDVQQELRYNDLLNRSRWMGFSTVQQATSYRQQMLNLAIQENKARFGGYLTPDQWLGYLQKEISAYTSEAAAITARSSAIRESTTAWLAHDNAVAGTSKSIGQLGESASAVGTYSDALNALPDVVAVKLQLDDAGFRASLAADAALLGLLPRSEAVRMSVGMSRTVTPAAAALMPGAGSADDAAAAALAREMETLVQRSSAGGGAFSGRPGPERLALPPGGVVVARPAAGLPARREDQVASGNILGGLLAAAAAAGKYRDALAGLSWSTRGLIGDEQIAAAQAYMLSLAQRALAGDTGKATAGVDELRAAWARLSQAEKTARVGGAFGGTPPPTPPRGPPGLPPGGEPPAALPPGEGGEPNPADIAAMRAAEEELRRLAAAEHDAGDEASRTADDWLRMAGSADSAAKAYAYTRAAALAWRMEQAAGAAASGAADRALRNTTADIPPMVDGLIIATAGWFGLASTLRLFGGLMPGVLGQVAAWHVLVDFIIEGLAVFIPALVTLIADLTAFGIAGADAGKAVYNRIVAIHTASDALQQTLAPMTGQLEKLHDQVRPMVWQLYGDAIDIAHSKTGLFNQLAIITGTTLDRLAAHVTVFATNAGKGLETFFSVGNADLAKLGTFFDNIGKALLALIKITQETHIDQLFLNFFVALSQLLVLITKLPTPILAAAVGLHAFWLWGGLAATVVMQLLGPLRALALALGAVDAAEVAGGLASVGKDASAFGRLKAGLTDIGAGLGALPGRLNVFSKAAKEASVSAEGVAAGELAMEGGAAGAAGGTEALAGGLGSLLGIPVIGWLLALATALVGVGVYLGLRTNQTQAWINTMNTALTKVSAFKVVGQTMGDLAAVTRQLSASQRAGTGDTTELANAQADLTGKLSTELDHIGQVSHAYGTNMVGALALMNAAGVKTSDIFSQNNKVWEQALQQVRGLVDGYKAMGQGLSEIQRDVSVQLVLGSDQYTSMQKLNQAWDAFQKLTAGPFSGIIKTGQDLIGFAKDAAVAGASMTGLGANALALQSDFQGTYGDVETLFSALRSAEAVTGDGGFSGAVKHAVQVLIPLAGNNKAAAAEISQLAQEAGGPATTSLQALGKWAGHTHDPLAALYKDAQNATIGASNLDQDAARLSATLQNDLNPAMANAAFNALGGQKAFNTFATDLARLGPSAQPTIAAGRAVASELLSIDKNSASAKAQFVGWAESMGLGKDAADKLWGEVSKGVKPIKDVQDALAGAAGAQAQLVKPGLWGQFEHDAMSAFDKIRSHPIAFALGGAFNFIPGVTAALDKAGGFITAFFGHVVPDAAKTGFRAVTSAWSTSYESFMRAFGTPLASWFTQSLPHGLAAAWDKAWSGLVSPVARAFEAVKHAITAGFDGWWKTHGDEVKQIWRDVTSFISGSWDKSFADVKATIGAIEDAWRHLVGWVMGPGALHKALVAGLDGVVGAVKAIVSNIEGIFRVAWSVIVVTAKIAWAGIVMVARTSFDIIAAVLKTVWDAAMMVLKVAWAALIATLKIAWDIFVGILSVAIDLLTGHWSRAWHDMLNTFKQVGNAIKDFWNATWSAAFTFLNQLWNNFRNLFVQIWHNAMEFLTTAWFAFWHWFDATIIANFRNFFTKTIPGWFSSFVSGARSAWTSTWNSFRQDLISPLTTFFTKTIPQWWGNFVAGGKNALGQIATSIEGSFKGSINWVIRNVINKAIGFINDVTGIVGIPKIKGVSQLAGGGPVRMAAGSVPGTGDEDGTHIIAMGGEYMLRKPARMALESAYGRGYMDYLNQADQWLGAGSRGNFASQGRPMAEGGNVGYWPAPAYPNKPAAYPGSYATGGDIIRFAEHYVGVPYVWGGTSPKGWDCSGFTQYVLEHVSPGPWHNVPRTSEAQYNWVNRVPKDKAGAGSLIFGNWPGEASPGHVGFYMGGQNVIDAQSPAAGTGYSTLSQWDGHIVGFGNEPNATGILGQIVGAVTGLASEAWQGIEGLTNAVGDALSGNMKPLIGLVKGGASGLLKLAKRGGRAVFDGVWSGAIQPLIDHAVPGGGQSAAGAVLDYAGGSLKKGFDTLFGAKDAAAKAAAASMPSGTGAGGGGGPASAGAAAAMAYAKGRMGAFGWNTGNDYDALVTLWMGESGWNRLAKNPSSGAYGIPQALPGSKMGAAANPPTSSAGAQIDWGMGYIKTTPGYGSPPATYSKWLSRSPHWYAAGGEVGDAMAAGGPFKTSDEFRARLANRQAGERDDYYGLQHGFAVGPAKYRTKLTMQELNTLAARQASEIAAYGKLAGTGLTTANLAHLGATARAETAVARDQALNRVPGGHPKYAAELRGYLSDLSVLSGEKIPPAPHLAADWTSAAGLLDTAARSELASFWPLMGRNLSAIKGVTPSEAGKWHSWRGALEKQQLKTFGLGRSGAFDVIEKNLASPGKLTASDWTRFAGDLSYLTREEGGPGVPGGINPPGTPRNSGWVPWHYFGPQWTSLRKALLATEQRLPLAQKAWANIYGPGALPAFPGPLGGTGTPGPLGSPGTTGAPAVIDLSSLIPMGPGQSVMPGSGGSLSSTGSGFASGGGLGDVSGMFALGGPVTDSSVVNPGIPSGLVASLSSVADGLPRTITAGAGAAGDRIGVKVGNLTIMNPLPEKPSDSITRSSNRLAFLAGRGTN